jgi:hypothetical protein
MICNRNFVDCIEANPNNSSAQTDCIFFIRDRCGTLERTDYTPVTVQPSPTSKSTSSSNTSSNPAATSSSLGGGGGGLKTEEDADAKVADEKVGTDEGKVFGPELEDTQRLEIGGREIPGKLEAGAGAGAGAGPVEIGMSEREESEMRRVVGNK